MAHQILRMSFWSAALAIALASFQAVIHDTVSNVMTFVSTSENAAHICTNLAWFASQLASVLDHIGSFMVDATPAAVCGLLFPVGSAFFGAGQRIVTVSMVMHHLTGSPGPLLRCLMSEGAATAVVYLIRIMLFAFLSDMVPVLVADPGVILTVVLALMVASSDGHNVKRVRAGEQVADRSPKSGLGGSGAHGLVGGILHDIPI
ncbi:hypothetical protein NX059_012424 [Plenodomus lindquistii]|nr:hypothetical protein NX059_012424 [Plenodomus lindquistii]